MEERQKKLETFRTEYRKLIGGAIIEGLINPGVTLANVATAARNSYDQDSTGNYTQIGGDHDQVGGDYDQTEMTRPLDLRALDINEIGNVLKGG